MASLQVKPPLLWSAGFLWPTACAVVVTARFITRRASGNRYGWDDWLILPAFVLMCDLSSLLLVGVAEKGMGYPTPKVAPDLALVSTSREQTITRKVFWVNLVLHQPTLAFIKLSCLAFYRRVFRTSYSKTTDVLLWILVAIVTGWGIAFTVTALFTCGNLTHLDYLWTSVENQMKCTVNQSLWQEVMAISDVIVDLLLLIFPLPYVWRLQMPNARKAGVSVIFLFGSLSIAASIVRMEILLQALNDKCSDIFVEFVAHIDEDFLSTDAAYFMLLEAGFGIITICLPTLAGAFKLKGVQEFFVNVSQIFSIHSQSSTSNFRYQGHHAGSGGISDEELTAGKENLDTYTHVVALRPLSKDTQEVNGVHVTHAVDVTNHQV